MKKQYPHSDLVHGVVFPNIVAMMTGVYQVTIKYQVVTAHYTDGTTECCQWPNIGPLTNYSPFELVGEIQRKARVEQHKSSHNNA